MEPRSIVVEANGRCEEREPLRHKRRTLALHHCKMPGKLRKLYPSIDS